MTKIKNIADRIDAIDIRNPAVGDYVNAMASGSKKLRQIPISNATQGNRQHWKNNGLDHGGQVRPGNQKCKSGDVEARKQL